MSAETKQILDEADAALSESNEPAKNADSEKSENKLCPDFP